MFRRASCGEQQIERLAEFVLVASSPKRDRDGYHYIYDPDHRQRPPAGLGKFYQTPKGWSTNPKYKLGQVPHQLSEQMTEGELQEYTKNNPVVPAQKKRSISEHKQSVISKFAHISESEIEVLEKLPEQFFAKVKPDSFRVVKSNEYALIPDRTGKRKSVILVKGDNNKKPGTIAHEFGHLILEQSGLLQNPEFIATAEKLFNEEFESTKNEINSRFKKVNGPDGKPIDDFFSHVFRNKGRGNYLPNKLNSVAVAIFGKDFKDCGHEKISELDGFLDSLFAVSRGNYGSGHKKGYIRDPKEKNNIHEFFANTMSAMVTRNQTMNRFFPKSMGFMGSSIKNA
jgi:hypothetical protein